MKMRVLRPFATSRIKIAVLYGANILNSYALWSLMTYFINVWGLSLMRAAALVTSFAAVRNIVSIGWSLHAHKYTGYYVMLMLSNFTSTMGLGFLSLSAYFYEVDEERCEVKCRVLSRIGLAALAMGKSEFGALYEELVIELKPLIKHKIKNKSVMPLENIEINNSDTQQSLEHKEEKRANMSSKKKKSKRHKIIKATKTIIIVFVAPLSAALIMGPIKRLSATFGIAAIYMLMATVVFLFDTYKYKYPNATTSPQDVFSVFVAFVVNIFYRWPPTYAEQLYERFDNGLQWTMDPIIRSQIPEQQQQKEKWESLLKAPFSKICKKILMVIPMCITFIVLGVITSLEDTYFNEQAESLEYNTVETILLIPFAIYEIANLTFPYLYLKMANCYDGEGEKSRQYVTLVGITISMVLAIPCCIVAAEVERKRLNIIAKKPELKTEKDGNKSVPMNVLWVVPQYVLLAGLDGISSECINRIFEDQLPFSMHWMAEHLGQALSGMGSLLNVVLVYFLGKISERGGRSSWFQESINRSRLDKYFWVISIISATNLLFFVLAAIRYVYKGNRVKGMEDSDVASVCSDKKDNDMAVQKNNTGGPSDDILCKDCSPGEGIKKESNRSLL